MGVRGVQSMAVRLAGEKQLTQTKELGGGGGELEPLNGAPCHRRYGEKRRMSRRNERKVQKGAEGKKRSGPTTCLPLSLWQW